MSSILDEARLEIQDENRKEQVKSLKFYLQRIDQTNKELEIAIDYIARDKKVVSNIESMTVEEFSKSIYYKEGRVR